MAIISSLITVSCIGLSGQNNDACTKALEAGTKQSGIEQETDTYESNKLKYLETGSYNVLGKENAQVMGGTIWLTKMIVDKKASINLPNLGICNSLTTQIDTTSAKLVFKWQFD